MFKSGYIAILGAPNAGKSTLLNAILKEKIAPVTDKPQTTRKRLKGIYTTKVCQMIFLDTPGVHRSEKNLNRFMLREIDEAVRDADVLVYLFAVDQPETDEMIRLIGQIRQKFPQKKGLALVTKIDLPIEKHRLDVEALRREFSDMKGYPISALTGQGLDEVIQVLTEALPEGPALYPEDDLTDENLRDLAAEIIREKAMALMYEEIPYSLAVVVNEFKEPDHPRPLSPSLEGRGEGEGEHRDAITRIQADLIVEHDSQKGMVIGEGGRMIKNIGMNARKDIETLLGTKVFLELKVKVDKNWTKDPARLARYGYRD
ncbi:MAG: GTPase Era [Deltaproteobacteria bacterium]|nr:GTPase Era [Deltaproteobacteria bacterium]